MRAGISTVKVLPFEFKILGNGGVGSGIPISVLVVIQLTPPSPNSSEYDFIEILYVDAEKVSYAVVPPTSTKEFSTNHLKNFITRIQIEQLILYETIVAL